MVYDFPFYRNVLSESLRLILLNILSHQIHNRYEGKDISKRKRNLVIAGGVTLSVIVSPVVAAVTVGKKRLSASAITPSVSLIN